jgi:hypothetical protein
VQGQYGQLGTNIAGINQALVDALGGTQRFQIGTANGIAQGYTAAAGADQSAAQQAAAALGGSAGQLSGTGGQAAAALSAPGVSAANATGGLIDAAKLRGANQQITNQQDLATALAALGASRTAEQAKEGSYYQGYLSDAQKANQSALQANQDAAFKYANLGIAQQNANSRAAYDSALAALSGQRIGLQATGLADTSSYRAGMLAQGADRTAIAAAERRHAATAPTTRRAETRATRRPASPGRDDPRARLAPDQPHEERGGWAQGQEDVQQGGRPLHADLRDGALPRPGARHRPRHAHARAVPPVHGRRP